MWWNQSREDAVGQGQEEGNFEWMAGQESNDDMSRNEYLKHKNYLVLLTVWFGNVQKRC